jgi:hypothetical protein
MPSAIEENNAGPLSIAKGRDFGNPHRIGLPSPTELERVILANARMCSSVVRLTAGVHKGRSVGKVFIRGHFISFFQVCFNLICTRMLAFVILYRFNKLIIEY